jgi:hypothetical protein
MVVLHFAIRVIRTNTRGSSNRVEFIPLVEEPLQDAPNGSASKLDIVTSGTKNHIGLIVTVLFISARVHVFEHVLRDQQCSHAGVEVTMDPIYSTGTADSYRESFPF